MYLQPAPGHNWSSSFISVRFQILRIWCLSSSFASSIFPSVLMDRDVRTRAKRVALKLTEPSELSGIFMDTKRWNKEIWGSDKSVGARFKSRTFLTCAGRRKNSVENWVWGPFPDLLDYGFELPVAVVDGPVHFNSERRSDDCEKRRSERYCAVRFERHVHGYQSL